MSEPNPFDLHPSAGQSTPRTDPKTSAWATTSLVLAILGPVFSCLCIPSILFALGGIFSGHKARGQIMSSNGGKTGIGMATTGLVLSYITFALCILMAPGYIAGFREAQNRGPTPVDERSTALREAESFIRSDTNGIANGNSPLAIELAKQFSDAMKELREEGFEAAEEGIDITDGEFLTYCELHEDGCLFLTQAPMLRKFADDAKDTLGELSWKTAQELTQDVLEPDAKLGVGMKGMLVYGQIRVGEHQDINIPINTNNRDVLLQFFPTDESVDDLDELADELMNIEVEVGESLPPSD